MDILDIKKDLHLFDFDLKKFWSLKTKKVSDSKKDHFDEMIYYNES